MARKTTPLVLVSDGPRELAAQTAEDGADLARIVEPATVIAISILQAESG
ncbi:hypothetical protein [Mycolicibacterium palauense]|nr:hypothetical protein [Mycolicibacterium palauense]